MSGTTQQLDINAGILDDISRLQDMEKSLYTQLEDAQTDFAKQGRIMDQIDKLTQMRVNMFKQLQLQFSGSKDELVGAKKAISTQMELAKVTESELNGMKRQVRKLEQIKNDKLRMAEIGSYEADRYAAYKSIMFYIFITAVLMLIISKVSQLGIIPDFLSTSLMFTVLLIGVIIVGKQLLDVNSRSPLHFNEYNFPEDYKTQHPIGYETVMEHDKKAFAKIIYGAETSYEDATDKLSGYTKTSMGQ